MLGDDLILNVINSLIDVLDLMLQLHLLPSQCLNDLTIRAILSVVALKDIDLVVKLRQLRLKVFDLDLKL